MERVRQVARQGTTILLVTHHVDELIPEMARVILFQRGRIAYDGLKSDVLTAERLGQVFGARLAIDEAAGYYHVRVV